MRTHRLSIHTIHTHVTTCLTKKPSRHQVVWGVDHLNLALTIWRVSKMLMWIKDHRNSTVESCGQGNQSFQRLVSILS